MSEIASINLYVPPKTKVYADWSRYQCEDFTPTARQLSIIEAVQSALDTKLYYTIDVVEHCKAYLGVTAEQAAVGIEYVENGDVGMDFFYARHYLEAKRDFEIERIALDRLKPRVGQVLGTLVFSDQKRNTSMVITKISSNGMLLDLTGKRGAYRVNLSCNSRQIEQAMNRAFDREARDDDFNDFVATTLVETTTGLFSA